MDNSITIDEINHICIGNKKPSNIITGFGYGCDVTSEYGLAVGTYAYVSEPYGVALGPYTRAKHENSVVIGQHLESKNRDSVLIRNVEFKESSISIENDKLLILANNSNHKLKCGGCDDIIISGVRWSRENDVSCDENISEISLGLCFDCIHDCVLQFKAKQSWENKYGDPLSEIRNDIRELKEKMKNMEK